MVPSYLRLHKAYAAVLKACLYTYGWLMDVLNMHEDFSIFQQVFICVQM